MTVPGRLQHRVACITGAGSGLGQQAAFVFAEEGAIVVAADINLEAAEQTVQRLKKDGRTAVAVKCDVSKESEVKACVELAVEKFGRLDVMFNNAGIMHSADDNCTNTDDKIWDLTLNVYGVMYGCKHALIAMRKNKADPSKGLHVGGSIINTASFVALVGAATPQIAYTTSKGAVLAMTRELAMTHALEGVRFNSLCPGPLETPLLMDFLDTDEKKNRRMAHLPMGRFGQAIEQAKAALFLACDDSSYMTGQDLAIDGGLSKCYVTANGTQALAAPTNIV